MTRPTYNLYFSLHLGWFYVSFLLLPPLSLTIRPQLLSLALPHFQYTYHELHLSMQTYTIMRSQHHLAAWGRVIMVLVLAHGNFASGFPWLGEINPQPAREHAASRSASQLLRAGLQSSSVYESALDELQQLETQPLCHRIAARLLVNNCQLLEGKDEATVLTDSGRQIRDFVDSYAASLAICDLERGSFVIPQECANFRESALSQLSLQATSHLHITPQEIDACLSGLGTSDSAWNTWISYRHKALRFCEAARVDNDRAQNILVFQRLVKIMNKLTDDLDAKYDTHMADMDLKIKKAGKNIDNLSPQIEHIRKSLDSVEKMLSGRLAHSLQKSTDIINAGTDHAADLQRTLKIMLEGVMNTYAQSALVHEDSLAVMRVRTEAEINMLMAAMTGALASTATLQNQIETSINQASQLESRQDSLEQGIQKLIDITENLSTQYNNHTSLLQQAQIKATDILYILEDTAASATIVGDSFLKHSPTAWWPYIWCPAVSLVMGSYGLPPSALRNLGLFTLGEAIGYLVSNLNSFSYNFLSSMTEGEFTAIFSEDGISNESGTSS
ncbi:hypothetical protein F4810DRAFT_693995 [Camillea tinctor]|nr:hypothetical protein F4810DRAFT_693995 [Camillea tinctor]